jgi:hypothetical protein
VVAGADGVAVFDALHRHGRVADAILQAFDLLELDGRRRLPRPLPLDKRKDRLANLLARVRVGIALNQHTDENGAVVFLHEPGEPSDGAGLWSSRVSPGQIGPAAAPSSRPHAAPQGPTVLSRLRSDLVAESSHLSSFLLWGEGP